MTDLSPRRSPPAAGRPLRTLPPLLAGVRPSAAMTVVVLDDPGTHSQVAGVVATLADLAVADELLVVYGWPERRLRPSLNAVLSGLGDRLPRHTIVTVQVESRGRLREREIALVEDLLEDGSLPVVLTGSINPRDAAAEYAARLGADRVLHLSYPATGGATLHQVWDLPAAGPRRDLVAS